MDLIDTDLPAADDRTCADDTTVQSDEFSEPALVDVSAAPMQAGDINTSSQRGVQIDALYSSSQSADTTAAAPHLVHDSITADDHLTTAQIDALYSSSQQLDATAVL